ncbi:MAG: EF-hand domain-containing protein [Gammaproteobacteria bacterium]|nr:EF-hand domain-containing protein [Gammaproteobacteria bacterium]
MNKGYRYRLLTVALGFLSFCTYGVAPLYAAQPQNGNLHHRSKPTNAQVFSIHDIDKSGTLSRDEYQRFVEQIEERRKLTGKPMRRFSTTIKFDEIDIDGDGYLTEDEMVDAINVQKQRSRRYRYKRGRSE